jgi:hypothetical protein
LIGRRDPASRGLGGRLAFTGIADFVALAIVVAAANVFVTAAPDTGQTLATVRIALAFRRVGAATVEARLVAVAVVVDEALVAVDTLTVVAAFLLGFAVVVRLARIGDALAVRARGVAALPVGALALLFAGLALLVDADELAAVGILRTGARLTLAPRVCRRSPGGTGLARSRISSIGARTGIVQHAHLVGCLGVVGLAGVVDTRVGGVGVGGIERTESLDALAPVSAVLGRLTASLRRISTTSDAEQQREEDSPQ